MERFACNKNIQCSNVWCWPCLPKEIDVPNEYTLENIAGIPTGSLYLGSRKGPLSELSNAVLGCKYDIIGIIFQCKNGDRSGTYVYTIDPDSNIVNFNLTDLIHDITILEHAVLPIKDFDQYNPVNHEQGDYKKCYTDCDNSIEWRNKLRIERTQILKELFQTFRRYKSKYDEQQVLSSVIGVKLGQPCRDKLTPAELVGIILFQAGMIWDDKFKSYGKNPVCHYGSSFFEALSNNLDKSLQTVTILTPHDYVSSKGEIFESESEEEDFDSYVESSLKRYLAETPNDEKGGEEHQRNADYYDCDYTRCIYPSKLSKGNPTFEGGKWMKPINIPVHAKTLTFETLRAADFLRSYYFHPVKSNVSQPILKICSLLDKRERDCNENKLNMSWFHDRLIKLQRNKQTKDTSTNQEMLQKLIVQLESMPEVNVITGRQMSKICERTSQLSSELHNLVCNTDAYIQYNDKRCHITDYQDVNDKDYKIEVKVLPTDRCVTEYVIVLRSYMWDCAWRYEWEAPFHNNPNNYYELKGKIRRLLEDLHDLKDHIPKDCPILRLVKTLIKQTYVLRKHIGCS